VQVQINKAPGLQNDLKVAVARPELEDAVLHIANRAQFMALPGLVRHAAYDPEIAKKVGLLKLQVQEHLRSLFSAGEPVFDAEGRPLRRLLMIGARNLGNNHGAVAWQTDQTPRLFHVQGDPLDQPSYCCLVSDGSKRLSIRDLRFADDRVFEADREISEDANWCVSGAPVLRNGRVLSAEEVIEQYRDIRHIMAFDEQSPQGKDIKSEIYANYPTGFRDNALRALRERGVPRQRFLHNCVGLSGETVFILQKEGTVEEVGAYLKEVGAQDGLILDNGGSVFCWAWWPYPNGGFIFNAPDFRPGTSALIAFVLRGPARTALPGGSVSFTVV
jgi:hypothetical protein